MITAALHARLVGDPILVGLLATYRFEPAIFTTDPPPGDATLPYIVTAGHVSDSAWDTKLEGGRDIRRDVRCYAQQNETAVTVEAIAERVRALLHRQPLVIPDFGVWMAECSGPIVADETDATGRIVTLHMIALED